MVPEINMGQFNLARQFMSKRASFPRYDSHHEQKQQSMFFEILGTNYEFYTKKCLFTDIQSKRFLVRK